MELHSEPRQVRSCCLQAAREALEAAATSMHLQNESSLATATATAKAYLKSRLSTRSTDKAAAASSSDGMPDALGSPGHRHAKSEALAVAAANRAGSGPQLGRASMGAGRRGGDLGETAVAGTATLEPL